LKTLYTNTVAESIQYDEVGGATSKPFIVTQYYDEPNDEWKDFEDTVSRQITLSNQNKRYGSWSFVPPSKTMSLELNNFDSAYSTGSGNPKASILKKNLLVRCYSGYELNATGHNSYTDNFSTDAKTYHVWLTGGVLYSSIASANGTISKYADFNTYDRFDYDNRTYSALGYYHKHYNLPNTAYDSFDKISVDASSNKFSVRWKIDGLGWSPYQSCNTGANDFNINSGYARSLDYMIRFEDTVWSTASRITGVKIHSQRKGYLFERGTFVCDEPEYGDMVKVNGRDYLKKALETEINLPVITNKLIGTVAQYIFDRCGVPYDVSLWDLTSSAMTINSTFAEELDNISGWKALDYTMDALNSGDDNWRLLTESDGKVSLKKVAVPDSFSDFTIDYFSNIESISKSFDYDKQLQRITVCNKDVVVGEEELLKSVAIVSPSYPLTITWGTVAMYVRYEGVANPQTFETARTHKSLTFNGIGATFVLDIYGCPIKNGVADEIWAERGNYNNTIKKDGQTYKTVNPMFDQDKCDALAEYMTDQWEDPAKKITLSMRSNPYMELNDSALVFDRYTYTDDIFVINEISESWNDPELKDSLTLADSGNNFGDVIYDKNGLTEGSSDLDYDKGVYWDMDLKIGGSDTTIYSKPLRSK
jgi:hypothetical protein